MSCGGSINGLLKVVPERIVQPTRERHIDARASRKSSNSLDGRFFWRDLLRRSDASPGRVCDGCAKT
jgi:hypothetical protein